MEYTSRILTTKRESAKRIKPHSSLLAWRMAKGFKNQREAAKFLGISQSYLSNLERHSQSPRRDIAKMLTAKTGVPVDALMGIAS